MLQGKYPKRRLGVEDPIVRRVYEEAVSLSIRGYATGVMLTLLKYYKLG
jgi:hypothetical protein